MDTMNNKTKKISKMGPTRKQRRKGGNLKSTTVSPSSYCNIGEVVGHVVNITSMVLVGGRLTVSIWTMGHKLVVRNPQPNIDGTYTMYPDDRNNILKYKPSNEYKESLPSAILPLNYYYLLLRAMLTSYRSPPDAHVPSHALPPDVHNRTTTFYAPMTAPPPDAHDAEHRTYDVLRSTLLVCSTLL
eukprot:g65928.t1